MPESIGGKWYLKDGDLLIVNKVDARALDGGKDFIFETSENANIFYYDEDLGEEFSVTYDLTGGPNHDRLYIVDTEDYDDMRAAAGL